MTRTARAIVAVCRDLGLVMDDGPYTIRRTYVGRDDNLAGLWSWVLVDVKGEGVAGSPYAAGQVVAAHRKGRVGLYGERHGWHLEVEVSLSALRRIDPAGFGP